MWFKNRCVRGDPFLAAALPDYCNRNYLIYIWAGTIKLFIFNNKSSMSFTNNENVFTFPTSQMPVDNATELKAIAELAPSLDKSLPILPLRDVVAFPWLAMPVSIGRDSSLQAVKTAFEKESLLVCLTQKDHTVELPKSGDLYHTGVACRVIKILELPDGTHTALLSLLCKVQLSRLAASKPFLKGTFSVTTDVWSDNTDNKTDVTIAILNELVEQVIQNISESDRDDFRKSFNSIGSIEQKVNYLAMQLPMPTDNKQAALEAKTFNERMILLIGAIKRSLEENEIRREVQQQAQQQMSQMQRQRFLEQEIRVMQDELGAVYDDDDLQELAARAEKKIWSPQMQERFEKEMRKLERYNPQTPEYAVQYSYMDTLLSLPWDNCPEKDFTLADVERILDRDHYGLRDVKDRIIEQMAVVKQRGDVKAGILCLYGPPGVGKTSLGKSVAEALGREYVRVSFGGLHDEAEIRGHRKTYLGAMPGRIITGLQRCQTSNPVFVLDEIDKIGQDFKGDPSTALLEVLDPEQNNKFHDNYIDADYDLSHVLFIATANTLDKVSAPLLDRMELIEISGYITEEKVQIARRHLVPAKLEDMGMEKDEVKFEDAAIERIITEYTRESGVRQLDKKIAKVIRRVIRRKVGGEEYPRLITADMIPEFLGKREVFSEIYENNDFTGVVTGLAWTSAGGEILFIETSLTPGKGEKLTLTGNLGDVMKESATIALQYLRSHADELGIPTEAFTTQDVHIHVPEGAVPKDGPSAGITMAASIASALLNVKVRDKLAMTGEITLRGKVLPVGGIKEKILAAKRAGITDIMLCEDNRKDIEDIDAIYVEGLTFHYVRTVRDVLDFALLR